MESIWRKEFQKPQFSSLNREIETDVLVIGGGITGLLCAYFLNRAGIDCVLAEAKEICSGVTQNTTAKVTYQHGLCYENFIRRFGFCDTKLYVDAQKEALEQYQRLCRDISCEFEPCNAYVYSRTSREKIERETEAMIKLGIPARFADRLDLPFSVKGAVAVPNQAQVHPLKLAQALAKDLKIFEQTEVQSLTENGAVTQHGRIRAKKIIVATHFPFLNKHGGYFLKLYQHRSYVLALRNVPVPTGMYLDESEQGLSFRGYRDMLLLGGGSHRTGKKGGGWQPLLNFAKKYYPKSQVVSRWATQDCMTLDGMPYMGQYGKHTPSLYVATGFNKWGMTNAMVAAQVLTHLVQGKQNRYSKVFSPSRSSLHPQLAINILESAKGLLTPTVPRCTHLGCALTYNPQEHSWDCSCHGSRFTKDGKRIENPAKKDKSFPKK